VDVVAVSEAVAGLLATGAAKELGQEAGGGLVAGVVARVRKVFGAAPLKWHDQHRGAATISPR
jgi:hypothetical protein